MTYCTGNAERAPPPPTLMVCSWVTNVRASVSCRTETDSASAICCCVRLRWSGGTSVIVVEPELLPLAPPPPAVLAITASASGTSCLTRSISVSMYLSMRSNEVPSGAVEDMRKRPRSSSGASSCGKFLEKSHIKPTENKTATKPSHRRRMKAANEFS